LTRCLDANRYLRIKSRAGFSLKTLWGVTSAAASAI
jgi:hypothetical protein